MDDSEVMTSECYVLKCFSLLRFLIFIALNFAGYVDAAMKTCLHLRDYEGILDPEDIYGLLALASCANRAFATCSRAFIRLEALSEVSAVTFSL